MTMTQGGTSNAAVYLDDLAAALDAMEHYGCPRCNHTFHGERAFAAHKVGRVGTAGRRCLTEAALLALGWTRSPGGSWRLGEVHPKVPLRAPQAVPAT